MANDLDAAEFENFMSNLAAHFEKNPVPFFAMSDLFPSDSAWTFRRGGFQYVLAAKPFWDAFRAADLTEGEAFYAADVADLDDPAFERKRQDVFDAIKEHMSAPPVKGDK